MALFLKRNHYKPDQVQDFIPSPFNIAACMYWTGYDPMTMKPVETAKNLKDRRMQRALLQFFKPDNYFEVRRALEETGRTDLIGEGCDCLIPARARKRRSTNVAKRPTTTCAIKPPATTSAAARASRRGNRAPAKENPKAIARNGTRSGDASEINSRGIDLAIRGSFR
ncbi:MAG: DUF3362 domain-containing protein [Pirellulales bacterium]